MGYTTAYTLIAKHENGITPSLSVVDSLNQKAKELQIIGYALEPGVIEDGMIFFECADGVKWYEHDEDMLAMSNAFPDMVFLLHGEGEEASDLWNAYYKAGQMEYCPCIVLYPKPQKIAW